MRFIESGSSFSGLFVAFDLTGQNLGEPQDGRPLHDRVMVAGKMMGCDTPECERLPAVCRAWIEVVQLRFRLDQDDTARVGARLVAVERQPVRSVDVVKPLQAFCADLAGDLAPRSLDSSISDRLESEAAEARAMPKFPARVRQVGSEVAKLRSSNGRAFRGTGTEQSIRMTSGTSCPAAASWLAISNATMPPIDQPPRM